MMHCCCCCSREKDSAIISPRDEPAGPCSNVITEENLFHRLLYFCICFLYFCICFCISVHYDHRHRYHHHHGIGRISNGGAVSGGGKTVASCEKHQFSGKMQIFPLGDGDDGDVDGGGGDGGGDGGDDDA